MYISVQHILIRKKTADILFHVLGAVMSLTTSLNKADDEICEMLGKHGEHILSKRVHSDGRNAQVASRTSHVTRMKKLFRVSRSKERISLAEKKTLYSQKHNLLGHLRTLRSEMPRF